MKRGQITVFLALLLSIICGLLLTIIESTRINAMRMQMESGMDIGLHSVFAEYNRALLSRYDLFYIDTSYGEGSSSIRNTKEHLFEYMQINLAPNIDQRFAAGDWFQMDIRDMDIQTYLLATDYDGRAMRRQAVNYMKHFAVYETLRDGKSIAGDIQSRGLDGKDVSGERSSAESGIVEISIPKQISQINALRGGNILDLVMSGRTISTKSVPIQSLTSHRRLEAGSGEEVFHEEVTGEEADQLFDAYIFHKCSYETKQQVQGALDYEVEYIIMGKGSDRENLEQISLELLKLREASNADYLFGDEEKKAQAYELALILTGGVEIPGLVEALTRSLIYAWAYAEAVLDVNCLLCNGRVPVMKSSGDWRLPLEDLLIFRSYLGSGGGSGLSYQEYLSAYLAKTEAVGKRMRCMDIIEANVRIMEGNADFCMDGCVEYMQAFVEINSGYGYEYTVMRDYGYEKIR